MSSHSNGFRLDGNATGECTTPKPRFISIGLTEIEFPQSWASFEVFNPTFIYVNIIQKKRKSIRIAN